MEKQKKQMVFPKSKWFFRRPKTVFRRKVPKTGILMESKKQKKQMVFLKSKITLIMIMILNLILILIMILIMILILILSVNLSLCRRRAAVGRTGLRVSEKRRRGEKEFRF